jgi:integrase/recombinase XerD
MAQAKTFTDKEIRRVLDYIATRPHALRNRVMLLMTFQVGCRVGEVAHIKLGDIMDSDGQVRDEVRLSPEQTKGKHARTLFLNERIRRELAEYLKTIRHQDLEKPLFFTQKRYGFTPNTLAQHFFHLYRNAGIDHASSHSGRRTFITNLASRGVGVRVLMSLANHRSISTTQAYIDVNDDMKRRAVELV